MASTTDTLNIIITSKAKGDGAKKTEKGLKDIVKAAKAFAAAAAASQIVKYTVELTKLGLEADRQATSLDNLADAAGHSGDAITDAIQEASQHTIDRMSAMQAANRAMVMDVAKSPKEFERLTKVAVALGRAMGQDAAKSIDDFVTASARQSQMIADNLGLTVTVGQATERYAAALGITTDQLTDAQKKQAFLNMMLEEGEKKMAELGETTLDGAAKAEQASAAWKDTKTALGQTFAALAQSSGALDFMSAFAREVQAVAEHGLSLSASFAGVRALFSGGGLTGAMEAHRAALEGINSETDSAIRSYQAMARAADEPTRALSSLSFVSDEVKQKLQSQVTTQGMLERTILNTADVIRREAIGSNAELESTILAASAAAEAAAPAYDVQAEAAGRATQSQLSLAASLKDATDAQIAQAAISQLGMALAEGDITLDQYNTAVGQVQMTFGLATPESLALAEGIAGLTSNLANGTLSASGYDEALLALIGTTTDAATQTGELKKELEALPSKKTITVEIKRVGSMPTEDPGTTGDAQALGTGFSMGGMTLVGERGPELVALPRGAGVFTAGQTRQMMRGGGMGGGTVNIGPVYITGEAPEVIWRKLERYARIKGKSGWRQLGR